MELATIEFFVITVLCSDGSVREVFISDLQRIKISDILKDEIPVRVSSLDLSSVLDLKDNR